MFALAVRKRSFSSLSFNSRAFAVNSSTYVPPLLASGTFKPSVPIVLMSASIKSSLAFSPTSATSEFMNAMAHRTHKSRYVSDNSNGTIWFSLLNDASNNARVAAPFCASLMFNQPPAVGSSSSCVEHTSVGLRLYLGPVERSTETTYRMPSALLSRSNRGTSHPSRFANCASIFLGVISSTLLSLADLDLIALVCAFAVDATLLPSLNNNSCLNIFVISSMGSSSPEPMTSFAPSLNTSKSNSSSSESSFALGFDSASFFAHIFVGDVSAFPVALTSDLSRDASAFAAISTSSSTEATLGGSMSSSFIPSSFAVAFNLRIASATSFCSFLFFPFFASLARVFNAAISSANFAINFPGSFANSLRCVHIIRFAAASSSLSPKSSSES